MGIVGDIHFRGFPKMLGLPNWPNGFSLRKNDGFSTWGNAEASPWSSPRAVSCLGKQPADDRDEDEEWSGKPW